MAERLFVLSPPSALSGVRPALEPGGVEPPTNGCKSRRRNRPGPMWTRSPLAGLLVYVQRIYEPNRRDLCAFMRRAHVG
jgi:hypothetical protein